jgi:hypothetical protein
MAMTKRTWICGSIFAATAAVAAAQAPTQFVRRFTDCGGPVQRVSGYDDYDGDGVGDFVKSCAGGLLTIDSGATGQSLASVSVGGSFAAYLAAAWEDLDGDGRRDFLVRRIGDPNHTLSAWSLTQPGSPLWVRGATSGGSGGYEYYGNAGDVDGDGVDDVLAGYPGGGPDCPNYYSIPAQLPYSGRLEVLSGMTGATLRAHVGALGAYWPNAAAGTGDVDQDGVADYVVIGKGRPTATALTCAGPVPTTPTAAQPSQIDAFVGATGAVRFSLIGGPAAAASIFEVADADLDGDLDVVVRLSMLTSASGATQPFEGIIDATTGAVLAAATTFGSVWPLGRPVGDVDLDGFVDRIEGAAAGGSQIRSGATQAILYALDGIGAEPFPLSDLDFDGTPEYAAVLVIPAYQVGESGWAALRFGATALQASVTTVAAGCGPPNQIPGLYLAQSPYHGTYFPMVYANGAPGAPAVVLAGIPGPAIPLASGCTAYLDPAGPLVPLWQPVLDAGGAASIQIRIPAVPGLTGASFRIQGFHFAPGFGLASAGAKDLVIGF